MRNAIPLLVLPKRFEALEQAAQRQSADISRIVHRVDDAASRVEDLLRQVRDGGLGRFEIFLGKSGSGKTTFFRTLTQFFKGVTVHTIGTDVKLDEVAKHIRRHNNETDPSVWFVHDRDNPNIGEQAARNFAESLRKLFREPPGKVVLIWPVTEQTSANALAEAAWDIGRDSIVDVKLKGIFVFHGIAKTQYREIADLTVRNLTPSETLETFGLTAAITRPLLGKAETIGEFYSLLEAESQNINNRFQNIMNHRVIPRLWVLIGGDSNQDLNMTIANLTQGRERQVDIDRILSFLDDETKDTAYMKDWQRRRNDAAFLLRRLDVRVLELPPNAALAAIRLFGDQTAKQPLNLKSAPKKSGLEAVAKTALARLISGSDSPKGLSTKQTDEQTASEYKRIQNIAAKNDKRFNKALAQALSEVLTEGTFKTISSEKQIVQGNIKPDIRIEMSNGNLICIEITWRTTGKGIDAEIDKRQSTLSVGHIQKYVLEKVMEYVKDYDL